MRANLTQQANNHINPISPGECETRKKPTYQATEALDKTQKGGGKLRTTQQSTKSEGAKAVA